MSPQPGRGAGGQGRGRPGGRPGGSSSGKPSSGKPFAGKSSSGKPSSGKSSSGKPFAKKPAEGRTPLGKRTAKPGSARPTTGQGGKGPRFAGNTRPGQPTRLPQRRDDDAQVDVHDPDGVRLQKLLAGAGVGSRRTCENLIAAGRVQVDGHVVTELGVRVDPDRQTVHVDGTRVNLDESRVYLAFNKPLKVVSTMSDDLGRVSLADYVGDRPERLFHVGRLDADTEGLLLLTNDGDLAHRLQHPAYGVPKTYLAQVPAPIPRDLGRRLRDGVELEDGVVAVDSFRLVDSQPGKALVELVLHEGKKHVVRRLLDAVGHPVITLVRTQVGPIHLGSLKSGRYRRLTREEVGQLYTAAGM
ncbi:pseudouridine synthase [Lapillicoccus jejuensis]|uniref:Pseudouridine synthase n=1 Tax=Lapillicoccus jejuensis TaxID=402171 RepID=A0A542E544_9MICO|nr:pseudouridine synthase [Lapillicoccus jejuensis]TQJ10445.1 23S rRNA pseudouridine2605 synthase [Lapillicoccus jejuensis]